MRPDTVTVIMPYRPQTVINDNYNLILFEQNGQTVAGRIGIPQTLIIDEYDYKAISSPEELAYNSG